MGADSAVRCPLTGNTDISLVEEVPVERLRRFYERHLGLDIDRFVRNRTTVSRYRSGSAAFEFYWPPSLAGDASFYTQLARFDWYYDEERWEHRRALEWINDKDRLLDVGCGSGSFLSLVSARLPQVRAVGLESSPVAAAQARARGLAVETKPLGDFAREQSSAFDVVTAFQVLEHVPHPGQFLTDLVRAVRPGGLIVLGVPNMDGVVGETEPLLSYALNMPPHHMGLWWEETMRRLPNAFPIAVSAIESEPINESSRIRLAFARLQGAVGGRIWPSLVWRLKLDRLYARLARERLERVSGHTLLGAFRTV